MWTITSGFKRFMRRLFLLFVFLAIVHVAVDAVFTWQLKSTINKLKAEGKLKPIEELIPPVSDSENAAPLYNKAFELMTTGKGGKPHATESPWWDYKFNSTVETIERAGSADFSFRYWKEETKQTIPKLVESPEMQKIYAIFEDASKKPKCNFIDYKEWPRGQYPSSLPEDAIRLLLVKATIEEHSGNVKEAINTLFTAYRVANHIKQHPVTSAQEASLRSSNLIARRLVSFADAKNFSGKKSLLLMDELHKNADVTPFLLRSLDIELKNTIRWFEDDTANPDDNKHNLLCADFGYNIYFELLPRSYANYVAQILAKKETQTLITLNAIMQENILEYPYKNYVFYAQTMNNPLHLKTPRCCIFSKYIVRRVKDELVSLVDDYTFISALKIMLALKVYKKKHGIYPETLKSLVPEILTDMPSDPFSGKEFGYKKSVDSFIVYSVGYDLKDDNGSPMKYSKDGKLLSGDILWVANTKGMR